MVEKLSPTARIETGRQYSMCTLKFQITLILKIKIHGKTFHAK